MTRAEVDALLANKARAAETALRRAAPEVQGFDASDYERPPRREASKSQRLWVPLPPSWNRVYKARAMPLKNGKWTAQVYKSGEAKAYAAAVATQAERSGIVRFAREVMLRFHDVTVTMERAGCDLDDRLKVYFDALNGVLFEDDEQVAEYGKVRRVVDSSKPGIDATFTVINVDRYGKETAC